MASGTGLLRTLANERLVLAMITANVVIQFLLAFPWMQTHWGHELRILDAICVIYFVAEIGAKLKLFGWRGFWSKMMNRFDFVVVLASLPALAMVTVPMEDATVILALRTLRLLRFLRLLHFIPDRDHILAGIQRALKASVGMLLALVIFNLLLALAGCHLFGPFSPEYFGDPLRAMYTMFKVFTIEGWFEIPDTIAERATPMIGFWVRAFFVCSVLSGGLLGLTLATAIFVDEMVMDNNDAMEVKLDALMAEVQALRQELAIQRAPEPAGALSDAPVPEPIGEGES